MSYTFAPAAALHGAATGAPPAEPAWASELEQRLLERVDGWFSAELDERVIRIVEDKLRAETERRMWRGGTGVY
jgi:hypothetical protein